MVEVDEVGENVKDQTAWLVVVLELVVDGDGEVDGIS